MAGLVLSPNFAFLAGEDRLLAEYATLAERYVFDDPNTALVKLRQYTEVLVETAAVRCGLYMAGEQSLARLLTQLRDRGVTDARVHELLHGLRVEGNRAVHEGHDRRRDALHQLKMARNVGLWWYRAFVDLKFKGGPFIAPKPPVDPTAELSAELEDLRQALDAKKAEAHAALEQLQTLVLRDRAEMERASQRGPHDLDHPVVCPCTLDRARLLQHPPCVAGREGDLQTRFVQELAPEYFAGFALVGWEWEVVPGHSQFGCGDLLYWSANGFVVVEVKAINGHRNKTGRRNRVERQALRYAAVLARLTGRPACGWVFTDDDVYAAFRPAMSRWKRGAHHRLEDMLRDPLRPVDGDDIVGEGRGSHDPRRHHQNGLGPLDERGGELVPVPQGLGVSNALIAGVVAALDLADDPPGPMTILDAHRKVRAPPGLHPEIVPYSGVAGTQR